MGHMKANSQNARVLVASILEELALEKHAAVVNAEHLVGASKWVGCTAPAGQNPEAVARLNWLLGHW